MTGSSATDAGGDLSSLAKSRPVLVDEEAALADLPDEDRHALLDPDGDGVGQPERDLGGGDRRDLADAGLERLRGDLEEVLALRQLEALPDGGLGRDRRSLDLEPGEPERRRRREAVDRQGGDAASRGPPRPGSG